MPRGIKCPNCGCFNPCPICHDYICDGCGADLPKDDDAEEQACTL